jgi:ribosomal protein S3
MSVDTVEIERNQKEIRIIIKTARPGLVIGRSGEGASKLKKEIDHAPPSNKAYRISQKSSLISKKFVHQNQCQHCWSDDC